MVLSKAEIMLRSLRDFYVAPSSLTTASMIDAMNDAKRTAQVNGSLALFNSLQVIASELGVFLPAYDATFMNTLTKLYDGEHYEEKRRTGKVNHVRIESPQLSILGGTTPSYLNSFLPEGAWDQGFTSRTILVFSGPTKRQLLFGDLNQTDEALYRDLLFDLAKLKELSGPFVWEPEAVTAITEWFESGEKPVPSHAKLRHYNTRRLSHLIKLSMVSSVARSSALRITTDNLAESMGWLFEAEAALPNIFTTAGSSADSRAVEDLMWVIENQFKKTGRPVGEHILVNFLKDRVPSYSIMKIIEIMVKSKNVEMKLISGVPGYVPGHDSHKDR